MALAELKLGNVKGNTWYSGNKITGNKKEGTIFENSNIIRCFENDMYLNTDTSDVYKCVLGGNASTAKWAYIMSIKPEEVGGIIRYSETVLEDDFEFPLKSISINGVCNHSAKLPDVNSKFTFDAVLISELKTTGRNLFDKENCSVAEVHYDADSNSFKTSTNVQKTYYLRVEKSTDYTISKNKGNYLRVSTSFDRPSNGNEILKTLVCENGENKISINTGVDGRYLTFEVIGENETDLNIDEILETVMLEKGNEAHPFEPYVETKILFKKNINDYGLLGMNGICDKIYNENGKWYYLNIFSNIETMYDLPDLNIVSYEGDIVSFSFYAPLLSNRKISNNYMFRGFEVLKSKSQGVTQEGVILGDTEDDKDTVYMFLNKERLSVSEETDEAYKNAINTWVGLNKIYFVYEKKTPLLREITVTELNKPDVLKTFNGYTNIVSNSFVAPVVEYDYPINRSGLCALLGYDNSDKLMAKSKIYKGVLKSGQTQLKINTDDVKDNSIITVFTSVCGLNPSEVIISGYKIEPNIFNIPTASPGYVTLKFAEPKDSDVQVGFRIEGEW